MLSKWLQKSAAATSEGGYWLLFALVAMLGAGFGYLAVEEDAATYRETRRAEAQAVAQEIVERLGEKVYDLDMVADRLADNIPYTIELTIAAMIIGVAGGIPLGVWAAVNRNKAPDNGFRLFSLIGYAVPDFYLGAILLIVFALNLGWFPITGAGTGFLDRVHHIILPALTLAMLKIAFLGRLSRTSLLEVMGRDYVRTARAKGAREPRVIYRHGLRNALLPLSTGLGLSVLTTLSGSVAVELVFNRPGLGPLLIDAITERDYPVIQGGVIVFASIVVLVNLLMEIVYVLVDPRIRVK